MYVCDCRKRIPSFGKLCPGGESSTVTSVKEENRPGQCILFHHAWCLYLKTLKTPRSRVPLWPSPTHSFFLHRREETPELLKAGHRNEKPPFLPLAIKTFFKGGSPKEILPKGFKSLTLFDPHTSSLMGI